MLAMRKELVVLLLVLALKLCVVQVASSSFPGDFLSDEDDNGFYPFQQRELDQFKKMLRMTPPAGREEFDLLLNGAAFPDYKRLINIDPDKIASAVVKDPELLERFRSVVSTGVTIANIANAPDEAYNECYKDLDAFLHRYLLEGILVRVIEAVCDSNLCTLPFLCDFCDDISLPTPREYQPWVIAMYGAMAKIPEGIREGKLHWQGAYEYCNDIEVEYNFTDSTDAEPELRSFVGQYNRFQFAIPLDSNGSSTLPFYFGACLPSTCTRHHVNEYVGENGLISLILNVSDIQIVEIYQGRELDISSDSQFIIASFIIVLCFVIVVVATVWDGCPCLRKKWISSRIQPMKMKRSASVAGNVMFELGDTKETSPEGMPPSYDRAVLRRFSSIEENLMDLQDRKKSTASMHRSFSYLSQISNMSTAELVQNVEKAEEQLTVGWFERVEAAFTSFSAYSNIRRIFHTDDTRDNLPCVNGIRALSFGWSIAGGTWLYGPLYNECWLTGNLFTALSTIPKMWNFQIVINSTFCSDSFLVLGGLLVTYWWLIRFEKNDKRLSIGGIIHHMVHKYWRLMPVVALCSMFYSSFYKYLSDGPFFPRYIGDAESCRRSWWANVLMVNNFVTTDESCFTWMWLIPVIFQLHLFFHVVLIPLVLMPTVGYVILAGMFIAHIGTTAGIAVSLHQEDSTTNVFYDYLVTPWCRAGSYIIGMVVGILLFKLRGRKLDMHWLVVLGGWFASLGMIALVLFIPYDEAREGGRTWSPSENAAYDTFARNLFSLSLGWIIFACHTGHGGIINSLLSYKFWWPLSKLSFTAYATCSLVISLLSYKRMTPLYITLYHQGYRAIGHFWANMLVGCIWALLWHYPLSVGVEKAVLLKDKIQWVRSGRHHKEELSLIEEEMVLQRAGVTLAGSMPATTVSSAASPEIELDVGGYVPYIIEGTEQEPRKVEVCQEKGEKINRQFSQTSM